MIIESVHIRSFGRLSAYTCQFDGGMQVIEGNNEAGKSTLAAFIRYMLYGFPRQGGSELSEKKKRISWQEGAAAGSMVVRLSDGRRYRIERATTATTGTGTRETHREVTAIIDLETNTPLPGNESAGERFLGVPEEVFVGTAFVGQIGSPRVTGAELNEAIENLLFSGNENLNMQQAQDKLDLLRRTLLYKNGKGGEIYDLERRERELADRLEVARERNETLLTRETELTNTDRNLEKAETEYKAAALREQNARNALLVTAYEHLHRAERDHAAAMDALREMDGMPAYRLRESDLQDLKNARRKAEEAAILYREARNTQENRTPLAFSEEEAAQMKQAESEGGIAAVRRRAGRTAGGLIASAAAMLFFAVLAAVGAVQTAPLSYILLGIGAAFAAGSAVFAVLRLLSLRRLLHRYGAGGYAALLTRLEELASHEVAMAEETEARAKAEGEVTLRQGELNRALGELDTVVRRFGSRLPGEEDIPAFLDSLEDGARRVMEKKQSYEATRVSSNTMIMALREQLAGTDEAALREALPPQYEIDVQKDRPDLHRMKKEFYDSQRVALTKRRRELESDIFAARANAEDPGHLGIELSDVRARIAAARAQYDACVLAYDALDVAGERLRKGISPHLSNFASRMMERLTDGRYTSIGISPELAVTVETESGTRSLDYMSAGTQDIAYLSLRMALIDLLYREKPPVCFDESFAHQDDTRAARMLEALGTLSEGGWQTLIFTCHGREGALLTAKDPTASVLRIAP